MSARIHARNLLANWVGHGANLVVLFFLSPYVVHTLGKTEYGIWSLLMVLTGYMGLFDLGVRASTGRYIILYLGRKDLGRLDQTLRTGLAVFSIAGLVMLVVGGALGWVFPSAFASLPPECHGLVQVLLPLLAVNVWLGMVGAVFSSVLIAYDRFDLMRTVDLTVLAIRTGGTILVLATGRGIVGLTAVTLVCGVAALLANYILARRVHPPLRVWPPTLPGARLRELFGYGAAAFVCTTADRIIGQASFLLVGALVSVAAVTVYSVGSMLVAYTATFIGHIPTTFFPTVQRAAARDDLEEVRWYYLRQVRLAFAVGLPAYVGYMVFGETFIRLWMEGPEFPDASVVQAAAVMALLGLSKAVNLVTIGSESVLAATGHVRLAAVLAVAEAVANLGLSVLIVLYTPWGLVGIAAGTLAACLLVRPVLVPYLAMRKAKLRSGPHLKAAGAGLLTGAAAAAWFLVVRSVLPAASWPLFGVQVALALVGYAPIALVLAVPAEDRRRLLRVMRLAPGPPVAVPSAGPAEGESGGP